MARKKIKEAVSCFAAGLMLLLIVNCAGQAAPYTEEAYAKIGKAQEGFKPTRPGKAAEPAESLKTAIDIFRELFGRAGYDFDATIRKVAYDFKNAPEKIPHNTKNVSTMIIVLMSYMKSDCEKQKVNCLDFFDSHTSESVKWIWDYTKFSP